MTKIYQLVQVRDEDESGVLLVGGENDLREYIKNLWVCHSKTIQETFNITLEEDFYYLVDGNLFEVIQKLHLDLFEVGEVELKISE
jgi:hypothetical protein